MSRPRIFASVGLLVVATVWLLLTRATFYRLEHLNNVEVHGNATDCYVIADYTVIRARRSLGLTILGLLGVRESAETRVSYGVRTVHFNEIRLSRADSCCLSRRIGPIGPVAGAPHLFLSGLPRRVLRLTSGGFIDLEREEAARVNASFRLIDELFEREGWWRHRASDLGYLGEGTRGFARIPLAASAVTVEITGAHGMQTVRIAIDGSAEDIVMNFDRPAARIGKEEFDLPAAAID